MLNKKYRLNGNFDEVYRKGIKVKGEFGMLIGLEASNIENCLFAIVIPKKVGKANKRNKFKRRVRFVLQGLLNDKYFDGLRFKFLYVSFKYPDDFSSLEREVLKQFNSFKK